MKKLYIVFVILSVLFSATNIFAQTASVKWPLTSNQNPDTPIGNIQAFPQTIGAGSASPYMILYPLLQYASDGQRLVTGYQGPGWPAGPVNYTRYIQFDVSPTSGNIFTAQYISFKYGDNPLPTDFNLLKAEVWYSKDGGELGLSGWTINLSMGAVQMTATTGADGSYCFNNLVAGTYTLSETPQDGWQQTYPVSPGTQTVTLASGQSIENVDFGNKQLFGSICGIKFNDLNGNGRKDDGELGLSGWTITLTGAAEMKVTTDDRGNYCFTNLKPGKYTVAEVNQNGWLQTAPSTGTYSFELTSGQNLKDINFGNKRELDCIPPPQGMVGWWPGDNNALDISGNNNHGTLQGGATYVSGKVANAFNVSNIPGNFADYISIPDNSSLNFGTSNFSIDAWVKTTNTTGGLFIVSKAVQAAPPNFNSVGYILQIAQGGILSLHMGEGSVFMNYPASTVQIADGKWHFVAATVDRKNKTGGKLYVDGNIVLTFDPTTVSNSITNTSPLFIAKLSFGSITPYENKIDEVEIFNRALSGAEIASIYNAGSAGKCKPTLQLGFICGFMYYDINKNGVKDTGEPGLPNQTINLSGTMIFTVLTDANGNYCFTDLIPGIYAIAAVKPNGWNPTRPSNSTYTVELKPGLNIDGQNFGFVNDPCPTRQKTWSQLGSGVNGEVYAFATDGNNLFVGGSFTNASVL